MQEMTMDRAGPIAHGLRTASGLQALMIDNDSTNAAANQLMHQQDVASLSPYSLKAIITCTILQVGDLA